MENQKNDNDKRGARRDRTKPGPATSTPNEQGRGRKRNAKGAASKNLPKLGKHEAAEGGSRGEGLH
ncbi:MAG TPA: hypothetical protein VGX48_24075 [Pyrinomonadaceae bacterium]|jgi:hypothetical protein|nr:hypothetical protein [Pyrinomonadaceae bacterium]